MGAAIIAGCDAAPVFEPTEGVFYFVTLFVEGLIIGMLDFAVPFRRDAGFDPLFDQGFAKPVAVIAAIARQRPGQRQGIEHQPCPLMVAHLAFAQQQDQGLAVAIGDRVKLGVQAAFRAPDAAGNSPFLNKLAAVR